MRVKQVGVRLWLLKSAWTRDWRNTSSVKSTALAEDPSYEHPYGGCQLPVTPSSGLLGHHMNTMHIYTLRHRHLK